VDSDFGFVYDTGPPVGTVIIQTPTHDTMHVRLLGKPAHAGVEPEKGVSAIQIAAYAISQMRLGRIDEETTANIGSIHGGHATNVVCPEVVITAEARSLNRQKVDAQVAHMAQLFEQAAQQFGGQAVIEIERHYEGYTLTENDLPVQIVRRALQATSGWTRPCVPQAAARTPTSSSRGDCPAASSARRTKRFTPTRSSCLSKTSRGA
jgi:tripeptide aminopeptidase